MCFDPVTLGRAAVGGGLSAAGGMAEQRANNRDQRLKSWANVQQMQQDAEAAKLRNRVLNEYVGRQHEFRDQNQGDFKSAVAGFDAGAQEAQRGASEAERNAFLQQQIGSAPATTVQTRESASPAIQGEIAKKLSEALASAQAGGSRAAKLGSYGDAMRNNGENLQSSARKIDTTNNFARGEIGMLGADQDLQEFQMRKPIYIPGANSSNPSSTLKGLGSLVGSLAGAYGKMPNVSGFFGGK